MKARDPASTRIPWTRRGVLLDPAIRVRVTAWAALVTGILALGLYIAALALVHQAHINDLKSDLSRSARQIAALSRANRIVPRLVSEGLIQVVDGRGAIVASTHGIAGYPPVNFAPPPPMLNYREGRSCEIDAPGGRCFVVVVYRVGEGPAQRLVYSLAPEPGIVPRVDVALAGLVIVPGLASVVGYLTWHAAGRVLRPVEDIRAELDEITATDLERRVPVPDRSDEIARLAESVNATLDRLEGAVARLRGFVSDVSHELRSPLTGLRMELELALSDPEESDAYETLEAVLVNAERLHAVLDDLLAIARLEADPNIAKERVDLQALADQEVLNRPRRSRFTVSGGDPVIVQGGRSELARLVTNLLDNADRHAASEVTVTLGVEPHDGAGALGSARTAVIEVYDDGPGVAPADRERVFERFTRLAEGRHRDAGGTGLGLAIARDIAVAHGGTLTLTDRPDGRPGARFVLRLPAV
ncbi:sensor histidine kinase [Actinomadura rugatobispora]|uniref:histidine kinase n=1 Tax=Actinomadura rugatobispora TaxID=1994 RepID=A0ABW1ACH7_9ACTN|nr:HAMP domain-containing sensor histidine kinase [Actinomadura rugatobispora]